MHGDTSAILDMSEFEAAAQAAQQDLSAATIEEASERKLLEQSEKAAMHAQEVSEKAKEAYMKSQESSSEAEDSMKSVNAQVDDYRCNRI